MNPIEFIFSLFQLLFAFITSETFFLLMIFPGLITMLLAAAVIIWFERKALAKIQLRVGPQYAGRIGGIFQPVADFAKLIFKESIIPKRADRFLFQLAPLAIVTFAATTAAVIPIGPNLVIADLEYGLLFAFAITSVLPALAFLTAWASNSVYPFLGGLRALLQLVAYEVPLWLSAVGVVIMSGTLNMTGIVAAQAGYWFVLLQPLGALVFYIALLAELERIPYDLPEAEPEIVTGYMSEYSGMNFGLLMLSQYLKLYIGALLFTTLFLGGWLMPAFIPSFIPSFIWVFLKVSVVSALLILPRGILPRVRISRLLHIGWARLLAVGFLNLLAVVFLQIIFFGGIP